ncbi:MAG: pseudouridine-5'-phosphate glycosidase [Halanaerobium sp.]
MIISAGKKGVYLFEKENAKAKSTFFKALELTIIAHGMPYPENINTALEIEDIIREQAADILKAKWNLGLEGKSLETNIALVKDNAVV